MLHAHYVRVELRPDVHSSRALHFVQRSRRRSRPDVLPARSVRGSLRSPLTTRLSLRSSLAPLAGNSVRTSPSPVLFWSTVLPSERSS